jgi:hypothetical protein
MLCLALVVVTFFNHVARIKLVDCSRCAAFSSFQEDARE